MLIKSRAFYRKAKYALGIIGLNLVSTAALADNLPALNKASTWISSTMVSVAVAVLGLQIMFRLWQVNQGQKEWSEVAKPVLVTAAIVAVPTIINALINTMK
jgi:protein-S-isoprenylcysteine O-methyltransferase Ste14